LSEGNRGKIKNPGHAAKLTMNKTGHKKRNGLEYIVNSQLYVEKNYKKGNRGLTTGKRRGGEVEEKKHWKNWWQSKEGGRRHQGGGGQRRVREDTPEERITSQRFRKTRIEFRPLVPTPRKGSKEL